MQANLLGNELPSKSPTWKHQKVSPGEVKNTLFQKSLQVTGGLIYGVLGTGGNTATTSLCKWNQESSSKSIDTGCLANPIGFSHGNWLVPNTTAGCFSRYFSGKRKIMIV
jgi:hypothetical protein